MFGTHSNNRLLEDQVSNLSLSRLSKPNFKYEESWGIPKNNFIQFNQPDSADLLL